MKKNQGFTLIEILISMLVLSIGLLGLAGLQMTGLRNNLSAYHRSQATQLAYDMADRMRANNANTKLASNSIYITKQPSNANRQVTCTTIAGRCTPSQMAEQDLFEWNEAIVDILPNGVGSIAVLGLAAEKSFTIALVWDDKTKVKDEHKTDDTLTFNMSFKL